MLLCLALLNPGFAITVMTVLELFALLKANVSCDFLFPLILVAIFSFGNSLHFTFYLKTKYFTESSCSHYRPALIVNN